MHKNGPSPIQSMFLSHWWPVGCAKRTAENVIVTKAARFTDDAWCLDRTSSDGLEVYGGRLIRRKLHCTSVKTKHLAVDVTDSESICHWVPEYPGGNKKECA